MSSEQDNLKFPFNEEFLLHLEYHCLSPELFNKFGREDLRGFWCDGVMPLPEDSIQLTKKWVNDKRKIETKIWIGKNGQTEYQLTLFFGKYALRRYASGASLIDCIPGHETLEWIHVDTTKRTMEITLK